jgi:hypothetical protein
MGIPRGFLKINLGYWAEAEKDTSSKRQETRDLMCIEGENT